MRFFHRLIALLALTPLLAGCGSGGSTSASSPLPPDQGVRASVPTGSARTTRTLGEVQLAHDPTLRADLLHHVVVDHLESASASTGAEDTGPPGIDVIPVKFEASATFDLRIDSPAVRMAVLRDAKGTAVANARAGAPATVTVGAGDHTLELYSAEQADATVFIRATATHGASAASRAGALGSSTSTPGEYVVELSAFPQSIVGVPTGVAAFVGDLASGPVNQPVQIDSWADFVARFGNLDLTRPTSAQVYQFFSLGGQQAYVVRVAPPSGGGAPALADYDTALLALQGARGFSLLLVPDAARAVNPPDPQLAAHALQQAESLNAFTILEVPATCTSPAAALQWWAQQPQLHSTNAAVYYGQLTAMIDAAPPTTPAPTPSPIPVTLGPGGTMAGYYAWNDATYGVWIAPANLLPANNITNAPTLTIEERAPLNEASILPVIMLDGSPFVGGARTAAGVASHTFTYLQTRRLDLYITNSINQGIEWVVFSPNDGLTWSTVTAQISSFMNGLYNQGAFFGASPSTAYTVTCGLGATMTAQDILNGYLIAQVSYAAVDPTVFIEHTFTLQTAGD